MINQADNIKITSWIANILGGLGVVNSAVANAPGSAAGAPIASPSAADAANIVAVLKQLSQTPAVQKAVPHINLASVADQAAQLQTSVLAHAPAANHTILDLLPVSMQSLAPALAPIVGTLVPGFGGSVLALGLGTAMQIFSNRIITARTQDHRTAANVGR